MKAFKYRISRQALATCYHGFIHPVIEYGNILYDSCTKELSDLVEEVQLEAACTVSGAKRKSSHTALYYELGWTSLSAQRKMHKLSKLYAIHNNLSPQYLSDIIQSYQIEHIYGTRGALNRNHLHHPKPNKELYKKSFFISTIHEWNKLSPSTTNAPSLPCFKRKLKTCSKTMPPIISPNIPRYSQIVIAQLRIGFSDLNAHLHDRGCADGPACSCGFRHEDIRHFLWTCPQYDEIRQTMINKLENMNLTVPINFKLLLYGNQMLSRDTNLTIQEHVSTFLIDSKRFLNYRKS